MGMSEREESNAPLFLAVVAGGGGADPRRYRERRRSLALGNVPSFGGGCRSPVLLFSIATPKDVHSVLIQVLSGDEVPLALAR